MKKIIKLLKNPLHILFVLGARGFFNWIPDSLYLRMIFIAEFGYPLNLKSPKTFNEKLQWLKLYDRNPLYSKLVDKYEVRKFVTEKIGEEYLIPLLGVWDSVDKIDFEKLPNQFVLKCNHDNGTIIICKDKNNNFDIESAKKKLRKGLKRNFWRIFREWPYKNVKPRIIAEKYMEDGSGQLKDYKIFCFNGEPKILFVASDRGIHETKFDFYDLNFNKLQIKQHYPNSTKQINKPSSFDSMLILSKKLCKNLIHCRADFYEVNGDIYFGELTFSHFAGFVPFEPKEFDIKIGNWLELQKESK